MNSVVISLIVLLAISNGEETATQRPKRGSYQSRFPPGNSNLHIGGVDVNSYGKDASIPLQETDLFAPGVDDFLPIQPYQQTDVDLKVDLTGRPQRRPQSNQIQSINYIVSNAIDKPVQEAQEYVPPQSLGTAIIPLMPPPAIPVNAVASNIPAERGAIFLGSGSLGVIDLGGGAYALGSGSLGYSEVRSNPRSSFKSPLLPPVQAAPNLLPAAVPSPQPPQLPPYDFNHPLLGGPPPVDQNGYEYLPPNRIGFGEPLPRPRPLKIRMAFATPSNLVVQPQPPPQLSPQLPPQLPTNYQQPGPSPVYGQRVNTVFSDTTFYH